MWYLFVDVWFDLWGVSVLVVGLVLPVCWCFRGGLGWWFAGFSVVILWWVVVGLVGWAGDSGDWLFGVIWFGCWFVGCVICAMCWVSDVGFGVLYLFRGSLLRAVEVWFRFWWLG